MMVDSVMEALVWLTYELNESCFQGTSFILEKPIVKQNDGYVDLFIW